MEGGAIPSDADVLRHAFVASLVVAKWHDSPAVVVDLQLAQRKGCLAFAWAFEPCDHECAIQLQRFDSHTSTTNDERRSSRDVDALWEREQGPQLGAGGGQAAINDDHRPNEHLHAADCQLCRFGGNLDANRPKPSTRGCTHNTQRGGSFALVWHAAWTCIVYLHTQPTLRRLLHQAVTLFGTWPSQLAHCSSQVRTYIVTHAHQFW